MHLMLYCTGMLQPNGVLPVIIFCVCGGGEIEMESPETQTDLELLS